MPINEILVINLIKQTIYKLVFRIIQRARRNMTKSNVGSSRTHLAGSDHHSGVNAAAHAQMFNTYDQLPVDELGGGDSVSTKPPVKPLQWSIIFINMASLSIAAYFLTSGVMQLIFLELGICVCGVAFADNDPSQKVTWLVASCLVVGPLRLLVSICVGRPAYNRRVWPSPSRHRSYQEQLATVALVPDIRPSSRDMSVLDREQLVAGIIHPAFYYRTVLIAWQEGLLSLVWLMQHILRLFELTRRFPSQDGRNLIRRDELLEQLFASSGSNYTSIPLKEFVDILQLNSRPEAVQILREPETLSKIASHTCELFAETAATVFFLEDVSILCLLLILLLLLPMLSRMFKFYRH